MTPPPPRVSRRAWSSGGSRPGWRPGTFTIRDPFQLQVINAGRLPPDRARALLQEQRRLLGRRLDILRTIRDQLEAIGHTGGEPYNDKLGWRLTVEAGLRTGESYQEWCDWAIEQIDASSRHRAR